LDQHKETNPQKRSEPPGLTTTPNDRRQATRRKEQPRCNARAAQMGDTKRNLIIGEGRDWSGGSQFKDH
jgi:hypothetical protein